MPYARRDMSRLMLTSAGCKSHTLPVHNFGASCEFQRRTSDQICSTRAEPFRDRYRRLAFGTAAAASVATVAVMANAIGNALSGVLHNRGYRSSTLIMIGASGITVTSFAFFFVTLPVEIRIIAAIVFGATGGLIPSSLFASMPAVAPDGTNISALSGMLTQGSAMGLLVGPPAVAACVSWFGSWHAAIPCMVILGGLCILGGHALQRFEDR